MSTVVILDIPSIERIPFIVWELRKFRIPEIDICLMEYACNVASSWILVNTLTQAQIDKIAEILEYDYELIIDNRVLSVADQNN